MIQVDRGPVWVAPGEYPVKPLTRRDDLDHESQIRDTSFFRSERRKTEEQERRHVKTFNNSDDE